ncbi:sperm-associated microtubule inner protein 4-like [Montipora capricornis]|uniref:sperm-associated microtubule inner protein 4-like n=1 Tax=Montipora capricornis TaxID=246305 RepID=UPI0035F17954
MTTALQQALYKEHQGVDYLSRNFESHFLHTPLSHDRITVSQDHFDHYLSRTARPPKLPWGRSLSYGGFGPIQLPKEYRPKHEPPTRVQKGHRHYGGGVMPFPRGIPMEQYYDLTLLKKSNLRRNDELVPSPEKSEMGRIQIPLGFPAEHPYSSHMPKFQVFPSLESPDDHRKGKQAVLLYPTLPSRAPASAPDPTVLEKTKGHFDRRELVAVQKESDKKPLTWPEHNLLQLVKGPELKRQNYYPIPPTSVVSNTPDRSGVMAVTPRTANALYNVHRGFWQSHYQQQFTGNGPQNILKLDNYDEICKGVDDSPREHFTSEFLRAHPLEGRLTNVRRKNKKKKKVIVGHGTELWLTDSEGEEDEEGTQQRSIRRTHGQCFSSDELVDLMTGPKYSEGYLQKGLMNPSGEYSDVHAFALAHPHLYYSSITNHVNSKHLSQTRPETALEVSKQLTVTSPIVNNMPSQVSDQARTGSTDSDSYPKWFRASKLGETRPSTALLELQNSWSKTEANRRFHEQFPESAPDIRRKPDLRITTNERRHIVPETGVHVYYFHR